MPRMNFIHITGTVDSAEQSAFVTVKLDPFTMTCKAELFVKAEIILKDLDLSETYKYLFPSSDKSVRLVTRDKKMIRQVRRLGRGTRIEVYGNFCINNRLALEFAEIQKKSAGPDIWIDLTQIQAIDGCGEMRIHPTYNRKGTDPRNMQGP